MIIIQRTLIFALFLTLCAVHEVLSYGTRTSLRNKLFSRPVANTIQKQRFHPRICTSRKPFMPISRLSAAKKNSDELESLSDIDARVLESLLDDETLDLKSEENLKKMLKNGVKKKEVATESTKGNEKVSEFSSSFFKALDDNEFWNSLKAKTDDILGSAKIFVQNRIERDAQLLASIGVFAWQRAVKDASRALPSKGKSGAGMAKKMRDSLFLLTNNSSFVQYIPEDNFILPPSKYSEGVETSVFEELNTPMDEIKSVSQAIRDILAGKSISQDRGLRSVAPAGMSKNEERQRMAFEKRKETTLKREKEGIDSKVMRATGSLTDGIAEFKREMEVEGNEAGYRAKNAQKQLEGTLESAGLLGGGANKAFRGIGERLFGSSPRDDNSNFLIDGSSTMNGEEINGEEYELFPELTKDDVNNERKRLVDGLSLCLDQPGETWLKPGTTIILPEAKRQDTSNEDASIPYFVDDENDSQSRPEESEPSIINNSLYDESWENVITTMVLTRNNIEAQIGDESEVFNNEDEIFTELQNLKNSVQMISNLAAASAGYDASEALKLELIGHQNDEGDQNTLLSCLEEIINFREEQRAATEAIRLQAEAQKIEEEARMRELKLKMAAEKNNQRSVGSSIFGTQNIEEAEKDSGEFSAFDVFEESVEDPTRTQRSQASDISSDIFEAVFVSEVLPSQDVKPLKDASGVVDKSLLADVEFEVFSEEVRYADKDKDFDSNSFYAEVEVVDDKDVEGIFSEEKTTLNSAAFEEKPVGEPNATSSATAAATKFALRSIDVVLYVGEKTFTVGIPAIFNAYQLVKKRTESVRREGMGKEGWSSLENINDASKRY